MTEMNFENLNIKKDMKIDVGLLITDERKGNAAQGPLELPPTVAELAKEGVKIPRATKITVNGTTEVGGEFMKAVDIVFTDKRELGQLLRNDTEAGTPAQNASDSEEDMT